MTGDDEMNKWTAPCGVIYSYGVGVCDWCHWPKADHETLTLAKIGLTALIDEATGYQDDREPDALRKMLPAREPETIHRRERGMTDGGKWAYFCHEDDEEWPCAEARKRDAARRLAGGRIG